MICIMGVHDSQSRTPGTLRSQYINCIYKYMNFYLSYSENVEQFVYNNFLFYTDKNAHCFAPSLIQKLKRRIFLFIQIFYKILWESKWIMEPISWTDLWSECIVTPLMFTYTTVLLNSWFWLVKDDDLKEPRVFCYSSL